MLFLFRPLYGNLDSLLFPSAIGNSFVFVPLGSVFWKVFPLHVSELALLICYNTLKSIFSPSFCMCKGSFRHKFSAFIFLAGMSTSQLAMPPAAHASKASIEAIRAVWPEPHAAVALQIAKRESGLQPLARGCGGACVGLFQISYPAHRHWLAAMGIKTASDLIDPVINSRAAYRLFQLTGSNWRPWCHSSGFPRYC